MKQLTLKDLKTEFHNFSDHSYDPWSASMDIFFQLAEYMYKTDMPIPSEWDYRPSPLMTDDFTDQDYKENYYFELFKNTSESDLEKLGNILHRYTGILKTINKDY